MKQTIYISILILGLLSCNSKTEKTFENSNVFKKTENKIKLRKLEKLFAIGHFDGDKKQDTIFEHNFSRLTKAEIEYSADPFQHEFDTVVKWFYEQDANLYLTVNKNNQDTLNLGTAQGLYCLINIGDNNNDGKDEIALVIDKLDFTRVNTCKIFTLCNAKWTLLKEFEIYEESFDFSGNKPPIFKEIKEFLENKNGQWYYVDYHLEYEKQEDVGKMLKLKLDKCK